MIILKFIAFFFLVIFIMGLIGGLVLVFSMWRLRKRMEKAFRDAEQDQRPGRDGETRYRAEVEGEVNMVKCPHCGTFTDASDPRCENCGESL